MDHCCSCGLTLREWHVMGKDFFEESYEKVTDLYDTWFICRECKNKWDKEDIK